MSLADLDLQIILFIQSLGEWLVLPMRFFTFLGTEQFFLLVAPALYWCLDTRLGARIGLYLMGSVGVNDALKLIFHLPRPYWVSPEVRAFAHETSFAQPSNHAQIAMTVWGRAAAWIGRSWTWGIALLLVFLIGASRSVLGVHFPSNVLVGWLVGAVLLAIFLPLESRIAAWFQRQPAWLGVLAALGASLLLLAPSVWAYQSLSDWELPAEWVENARNAFPDAEPIHPVTLDGAITGAGGFFGMAAGLVLLHKAGGFRANGSLAQLLLRFVIGLVGLLVLWMGLGEVFPRGASLLPHALRYLRYALLGLWVAWLAPLLFIRLRLAQAG